MKIHWNKSDSMGLIVTGAETKDGTVAITLPPGDPACREALARVGEALGDLSRAVSLTAGRAPSATVRLPEPELPARAMGFESIEGLPEINEAIQDLIDGVTSEILTAQPDGPRPIAVLDEALTAVRDRIAAGVSMRTLYQHSTRFDEPTKEYVRAVTSYGAQVRTLAEFFDRMIIVDRRAALIPANAARTSAVLITLPAVVHFLADIFERAWDRAESYPFLPVRAADAAPEVIPAIRGSIRRLLIEGRSDKEIARRLGLSLRSLQAHVARLKEEHGAEHRLQLGYLMGLRSGAAAGREEAPDRP
ncbi:LuxR family transcriptional regulator [Streptomyces spongiicola]|uniref:LuxR family transcriptional regulator n=1 Tax=Streptomyces spongiicola TaxID=1690221 RepID=UPI0013A52BEB|nr:LuxR family transcriptional regulator [Streptomyces spongiicola]